MEAGEIGQGCGAGEAGLRTGPAAAAVSRASARAGSSGAGGPSLRPQWLCQTPSIPARAPVLRQRQETTGTSEW